MLLMPNTTVSHEPVAEMPESVLARHLPRVGQVQWDHYYMQVALTVQTRANCWGALVGAVLVIQNRIVSTGFNGTPAGFTNCRDGGCARCSQREHRSRGEFDKVIEPEIASGPKQLDVCLCVHAEANALLSAAKFGNGTDGAELYVTSKPCFTCLKEAYQAGVRRIVWLEDWEPTKSELLKAQYLELVEHLSEGNPRHFEQLHRQRDIIPGAHVELRQPILDHLLDDYDRKAAAAAAAAEAELAKASNATPKRRTPTKATTPAARA
jgi:dCMP deaminase